MDKIWVAIIGALGAIVAASIEPYLEACLKARKSGKRTSARSQANWRNVIIAAVVGAVIGGGGTYLVMAGQPPPEISVTEPAQPTVIEPASVVCPPTDLCVFSVRGASANVATSSQTIVIFVDPGGGNWWPQNLDFPVRISRSGDWEGGAQIGDEPQPSGTEFHIIAFLMNRNQVPKVKQPYTDLPFSITSFGPVHCRVQ